MPLSARRRPRQFKYAMYFDGVDDHVVVPYSPSYKVLGSGTWIAWAFLPSLKLSGFGDVFRDGAYPYRRAEIELDYTGTRLLAGFEGVWIVTPVGSLRNYVGMWLMFTYRRISESGVHSLIVNNFEASWSRTFGAGTLAPDFTTGLAIAVDYPLMYVSIMMIYSRALSDSEILWNYNNPDNPIRNGLVLWLRADPAYIKDIDGDGVLEWVDLSGYGNHGKIYGARLVQLIKSYLRTLKPLRVLPCAR
jgi:hypothetical protein